jgi:hypothetical protein
VPCDLAAQRVQLNLGEVGGVHAATVPAWGKMTTTRRRGLSEGSTDPLILLEYLFIHCPSRVVAWCRSVCVAWPMHEQSQHDHQCQREQGEVNRQLMLRLREEEGAEIVRCGERMPTSGHAEL